MHAAPAWLTVNSWPPIVIVPVRGCDVALASAVKLTLPVPLPFGGPLTISHPTALLAAVHAQPAGAVTVAVPLPPPTGIDWLVGLSEYAQDDAA